MNVRWWLSIGLVLILTGCASQEKKMARKEAKAVATVSVASTLFRPHEGQQFAWYSPIIWAGDFEGADTEVLGKTMVNAVEHELERRGYRMTEASSQADYIIGAVVMNGGQSSTQTLSEFFHAFPGLDDSAQGLDAAIALIGVVEKENSHVLGAKPVDQKVILWRSALEAYLLGDTVTLKRRKKRVQTLVKKLMISFPSS